MDQQFRYRRESIKRTDKRAGKVLEVVSTMRVINYFCYEGSFLNDIFNIRKQELKGINKIQHSQSSNIALAFSLPVLAATLAFVTYTETSSSTSPWVFASSSLFQLLRQPMMFLPRALSAISDACTAFAGLSLWFNAPLRDAEPFVIDRDAKQEGKAGMGVWVRGAAWVWEAGVKPEEDGGEDKKKKHSKHSEKEKEKALDTDSDLEPFALHDIFLAVPRGSLAAIVGRVGSGNRAGTYPDLIARGGEFARLDREFGGAEAKESSEEGEEEQPQLQVVSVEDAKKRSEGAKGTGKLEGRLMVKETRTTGGITFASRGAVRVYGYYMKSGGGCLSVPAIVLAAIVMQGSAVANSYVLVWWQANTFQKPFSFYQILYALLGIAQAAFTWLMSQRICTAPHSSTYSTLRCPSSTPLPMGHIISIFGKDIDTIDNTLPIILVLAQVIGSVILITILEHYFIVAAVLIVFGFTYFLQFYRSSTLELKRLDSILRLHLRVAHCYGGLSQFVRDNKYYIDLENRALFLTVTNQQWLAVRLDAVGSILVFLVGIFAAVGEDGIGPGQIGLILTYTSNEALIIRPLVLTPFSESLPQIFAVSMRSSTEVENYMNSVERDPDCPTYCTEYRSTSNLERRIGVVGRTGAGKPSLTLCLLRIVEYFGQIVVDECAGTPYIILAG
ncbi:hypothetical protein B0H14DRAFT_2599024 [Mycena olivaceomarginata]|nr:hypothetical protein B0H14DRAFT_2599024 [Mycena olivaceomarginata]